MNDAYLELFDENPSAPHLLDIDIPKQRPRSAWDHLRELTGLSDILQPASLRSPINMESLSFASNAPATDRTQERRVHYDAKKLKALGAMCGNRLPPASSVQAMFLYEMQRHSEQERLFHGELFRLARAEDKSKAQQVSIYDLQKDMKHLAKQIHSKDVDDDERLATSKVRMDVQAAKINEQSLRINDQDEQIQSLQQRLEGLAAESQLHGVANDHTNIIHLHTSSLTKLGDAIGQLESVNDSHDAEIADIGEQIRRLEQNDAHAVEMFRTQHANIESALANIQAVKSSFESSGEENLKIVNTAQASFRITVDNVETSLQTLRDDMVGLAQEFKTIRGIYNLLSGDLATSHATCATLQTSNDALNQDIAVLFDERDMLVQHVNAACARIDKLEGIVRALTAQAISPTLSHRSDPPHKLPVSVYGTNGGKVMDLAVPKGSSVVEYRRADSAKDVKKENSKPIRAFTPGKQWEQEQDGGEGDSHLYKPFTPG